MRHLFSFVDFLGYCYGANYIEREFDETILYGAPNTAQKHKAKEATEAETRQSIIDIDLQTVGWNIGVDCIEEVQIFGLPNTPSGTGFVDYVLKDDNGKPLAIVEAKRSSKDAKAGLTQGQQYEAILKEKYGFYPLCSVQTDMRRLFGMELTLNEMFFLRSQKTICGG